LAADLRAPERAVVLREPDLAVVLRAVDLRERLDVLRLDALDALRVDLREPALRALPDDFRELDPLLRRELERLVRLLAAMSPPSKCLG